MPLWPTTTVKHFAHLFRDKRAVMRQTHSVPACNKEQNVSLSCRILQNRPKKSSGFVLFFALLPCASTSDLFRIFFFFLFAVSWIISASVCSASLSVSLESSPSPPFVSLSLTIWPWTDPCEVQQNAASATESVFFCFHDVERNCCKFTSLLKSHILSAQCHCLFPIFDLYCWTFFHFLIIYEFSTV